MAEQKKTNEALNVEDALTQSEAFFIKNKKAIIGAVVAVIIIIAGVVMYKNLYADPREEKAQAALFKGQEYFEADAYAQALNGDSIGFAGFVKVKAGLSVPPRYKPATPFLRWSATENCFRPDRTSHVRSASSE